MKIFMALVLALTVSAGVAAQMTTTNVGTSTLGDKPENMSTATTSTSTIDKLKAMKLSARLETESFTERENANTNVSGYTTNLYPMLSYGYSESTSFWLYPQMVVSRDYARKGETSYTYDDGYLAFRFDQIKILNQKQQGLDFSASTRYLARVSPKARSTYEQYGELNLRFYANKKFGDRFLVYAEPRLYFVNTKDRLRVEGEQAVVAGRRSTATYRHDLYLIPEYTLIKDRLSIYVQTLQSESISSRNSSAIDSYDEISTGPGINFQFNDKLGVGTLFSSYLSKSHQELNTNLKLTASATYQFSPQVRAYMEAIFPFYNENGKFDTQTTKHNYSVELDLSMVAF